MNEQYIIQHSEKRKEKGNEQEEKSNRLYQGVNKRAK
jgi:hypothetical protein